MTTLTAVVPAAEDYTDADREHLLVNYKLAQSSLSSAVRALELIATDAERIGTDVLLDNLRAVLQAVNGVTKTVGSEAQKVERRAKRQAAKRSADSEPEPDEELAVGPSESDDPPAPEPDSLRQACAHAEPHVPHDDCPGTAPENPAEHVAGLDEDELPAETEPDCGCIGGPDCERCDEVVPAEPDLADEVAEALDEAEQWPTEPSASRLVAASEQLLEDAEPELHGDAREAHTQQVAEEVIAVNEANLRAYAARQPYGWRDWFAQVWRRLAPYVMFWLAAAAIVTALAGIVVLTASAADTAPAYDAGVVCRPATAGPHMPLMEFAGGGR